MPYQTHRKRWYQLVENFDIYQHVKNQRITHLFLEILQRPCILVILSTLGIPGHAHQV